MCQGLRHCLVQCPQFTVFQVKRLNLKKAIGQVSGRTCPPCSLSASPAGPLSLSVVLYCDTAKNGGKDLNFPQKTRISVPTPSLTLNPKIASHFCSSVVSNVKQDLYY